MDYDEHQLLSLLPPRGEDMASMRLTKPVQPMTMFEREARSSVVRRYVDEVVNHLPVFDTTEVNLEPLLAALFRAKVVEPVTAADVEIALASLPPAARSRFKQLAHFYPKVLKTFNGPAFQLVPTAVVLEAVNKELAMRGMRHGWGIYDPPDDAIAHRLLVASGLDERHLPKYTPLPVRDRDRFMRAWNGACKLLGWVAYNPRADVNGATRDAKARAAAEVAAADADET